MPGMPTPSPFPANPIAEVRCQVRHGQCRFTVLSDRLIRCEYAADGVFEDRPSLMVVNRRFPRVAFTVSRQGAGLTIRTAAATLTCSDCGRPFAAGGIEAEFDLDGGRGRWRWGDRPAGNLGGTARTLDGCDGDLHFRWGDETFTPDPTRPVVCDQGLLSRDGWVLLEDRSVVLDHQPGADQPWCTARPAGERQDCYLLLHGHDYAAALREGALLVGRQTPPPRWVYGYWYSRYWAYTDRELEEVVAQHQAFGVPLDCLVIDMDWHQLGWTGYSWSKELFPDHRETLARLKAQNLRISLNLHPADGVGRDEERYAGFLRHLGPSAVRARRTKEGRIPFDCTDPAYMQAYFAVLHRPLEDEGVDLWWMDWQQGQNTRIAGLDPLPWVNHLHWQDQARRGDGRRPAIFSRYGGLGSGRMPIGFSGDTTSTWRSLAYQPRFTAQAANVLFGHWSHDIGGHLKETPEPELYARWIQFGCWSPIVRSHSTKSIANERRIWEFPDPWKWIMLAALRRRYELVPYIASEWRANVESGRSLLRPMYHDDPGRDDAYRCPDQYRFGSRLVVAPAISPVEAADGQTRQRVWLPEGAWIESATGRHLAGGWHEVRALADEVPVFLRPGCILPGQWGQDRIRPGSPPHLLLDIWAGGDDRYLLHEDDGVSQDWQRGREALIAIIHRERGAVRTITVEAAAGSFPGFHRRRPLRVRVHLAAPPSSVRVGGRSLPWSLRGGPGCWHYDGDEATLVIDLPAIDLGRDTTIAIRHRRLPAHLLAGLPGRLRRLRRAMQLSLEVSAPRVVHPEERLCAALGQTGNRISRRPEGMAAELAALGRGLGRLDAVLAEHQDRLAARAGAESKAKAQRLMLARRLLASIA